jgi:hypothetical protein
MLLMPTANHQIGETFSVQFAWQLPEGDYIRAIFEAKVLDLVSGADKYIVRLTKLIAGRQESSTGQMRGTDELSKDYWGLVGELVGNKLTIAYEAEDGRAVHLRLATLTGEHNYFTRFAQVEQRFQQETQEKDSEQVIE